MTDTKEEFKNEPRSISLKDRNFEANGKKYYIAKGISINRWKQYEKLQPRLTYGLTFKQIDANISKAMALLNKPAPEPGNAYVILHNIRKGMENADDEKNVHPALIMCTLVMNREGEDVGVYDEAIALDKINDWTEGGLDILSFFAWAMNSIDGFRETYIAFITAQANLAVEAGMTEEEKS